MPEESNKERIAKTETRLNGVDTINRHQNIRMDRMEDKMDKLLWLIIGNLAAAVITLITVMYQINGT